MSLKSKLRAISKDRYITSSAFPNTPMLCVEKRYVKKSCNKGWIFIHIPKCAGTSLKKALNVKFQGHPLYRDMLDYDARVADIDKFTVVRDPVDRFVSAYNHIRKDQGINSLFNSLVISRFSTINEFIDQWVDFESIYTWPHFMPQYEFLINHRKIIDVDNIFKLEELDDSLELISSICGANLQCVQVSNSSSRCSDSLLTKSSVQKLKKIYFKDYDAFGYPL